MDKQLISKDTNPTDDGWMFGATTSSIALTDSYCTNLVNGAPAPVQIIFGCLGYIRPINIP